jgi:hypothetical protein
MCRLKHSMNIVKILNSSARTKFCRCLNLRQNQNFLTSLFITFFDVLDLPQHDSEKKILVSVGLDLGFRFSLFCDEHHRNVVQTSFWCQNAGNCFGYLMLWQRFNSLWNQRNLWIKSSSPSKPYQLSFSINESSFIRLSRGQSLKSYYQIHFIPPSQSSFAFVVW